jgi:hypothetical protein
VKIPLPSEEFLKNNPPAKYEIRDPNLYGFVLRRKDVVIALQKAGKEDAARYYENSAYLGIYLTLRHKYGNLVGENPPGFSKEELREYMQVMHRYSGNGDISGINNLLMSTGMQAIYYDQKYHLESWG